MGPEGVGAGEAQQLLDRRLEVVAPAHDQVEALPGERHEVEPELLGRRPDGGAGVGLALLDRQSQVGLAQRRLVEEHQLLGRDAGLLDQVTEQELAAGRRLALDDPGALGAEVREAGDPERVARRHHQPLLAPRPLDDDHVHAGEACLHDLPVVLAALRVEDVEARNPRLARLEALEPVEAAAGQERQVRVRLPERPVEERIVAAGDHGRRRLGEPPGGIGDIGGLGQPLVDQELGEKQLAGDPGARNLAPADEVVDLALLDAQVFGDLAGAHHLGQGPASVRSGRSISPEPRPAASLV